jgi:hypothetical protein
MRSLLVFANIPFITTEQIVWPNLSTLKEEGKEIVRHFNIEASQVLDYLDHVKITKNLSEKDAVAVLEILLIKVERSAIANHAIVEHRFYQHYSRELVEFVLKNTCPDLFSQLYAAETSPVHKIFKYRIVAGKRHPEFEYVIDSILANPRSVDDLKFFVGICLDHGVDERILCKAVFLKVVGKQMYDDK